MFNLKQFVLILSCDDFKPCSTQCKKYLFSFSHSEMSVPGGVLLEAETLSPLDQMRQRWENLNKDQSTKLQLSLNSLEQDQLSPVCVADFYSQFCSRKSNVFE